MSSIGTVSAGSRNIHLYAFTGQVVDQQKTIVTETVQNSNAIQTQSRTSTYNRIFIRAANGEERDLELVDSGLGLRAGNTASFMWGIPDGKEKGDYLAVINHDSGGVQTIRKPINDLAGPPFYNMLLIIAVIIGCVGLFDVFSGNIGSAIIMLGLGGGGVYWIYSRQKKLLEQVNVAAKTFRPAAA